MNGFWYRIIIAALLLTYSLGQNLITSSVSSRCNSQNDTTSIVTVPTLIGVYLMSENNLGFNGGRLN
jgi:hypothetical protein